MTPNEKTIAAMTEGQQIIDSESARFNTSQELFDDLDASSTEIRVKPRHPKLSESGETYKRLREAISNKFTSLFNDEKVVFVKTQNPKIDFFQKFTDLIHETDRQHYNCICCKAFFKEAADYGYLNTETMQVNNILQEVYAEQNICEEIQHTPNLKGELIFIPIEMTTESRNQWDHFYGFTQSQADELNKRPAVDINFVSSMVQTLVSRGMNVKHLSELHNVMKSRLYKPETVGLLTPLVQLLTAIDSSPSMSIGAAIRILHRESNYGWLKGIMSSNAGNVIDFMRDSPDEEGLERLISMINSNTDPERYQRAIAEASEQALNVSVKKLAELGVPRTLERRWGDRDDLDVIWTQSINTSVENPVEYHNETEKALAAILSKKTGANKIDYIGMANKSSVTPISISIESFIEKVSDFSRIELSSNMFYPVMFTAPVDDADYTGVYKLQNGVGYRTTTEPVGRDVLDTDDKYRGLDISSIVKYDTRYVFQTNAVKKYLEGVVKNAGTVVLGPDIKPEHKGHSRAWTEISKSMTLEETAAPFTGISMGLGMTFTVIDKSGLKFNYKITSEK